jgi:hypothetical protein
LLLLGGRSRGRLARDGKGGGAAIAAARRRSLGLGRSGGPPSRDEEAAGVALAALRRRRSFLLPAATLAPTAGGAGGWERGRWVATGEAATEEPRARELWLLQMNGIKVGVGGLGVSATRFCGMDSAWLSCEARFELHNRAWLRSLFRMRWDSCDGLTQANKHMFLQKSVLR